MKYGPLQRRFAGGFSKLSQEGSCGRAPRDGSTAFSKSLLRSDWDVPYEAHPHKAHPHKAHPHKAHPLDLRFRVSGSPCGSRGHNRLGTSTNAVAHRLKRFQKLHQLPALLLRQRRQHLAVQLRRASRGVFVARVGVAPAQSAEAKTLITIAAKTDLDRIKLAAAHHKLIRSVLAIFGVVRALGREQ